MGKRRSPWQYRQKLLPLIQSTRRMNRPLRTIRPRMHISLPEATVFRHFRAKDTLRKALQGGSAFSRQHVVALATAAAAALQLPYSACPSGVG